MSVVLSHFLLIIVADFCSKIVPCTEPPDVIVTIKFFSNGGGALHLGVGTERGEMLNVSLCSDITQPSQITSLRSRSVRWA